METLAIVLVGSVIAALQLCGIRAQRQATKVILRQNTEVSKIVLRSGVAREAKVRTLKAHAPTPIVDSNPREKRRSG